MSRVVLLVNPSAGGGRAGTVWAGLRDGLPSPEPLGLLGDAPRTDRARPRDGFPDPDRTARPDPDESRLRDGFPDPDRARRPGPDRPRARDGFPEPDRTGHPGPGRPRLRDGFPDPDRSARPGPDEPRLRDGFPDPDRLSLFSAVHVSTRFQVIAAPDATSARRELDTVLAEGGVERVIAVGGDGTAHLVVNALLASGTAHETAFGLVPAGTGSDFARSLGLPQEPAAALTRALDAEPRTIDAVAVEPENGEPRYVLNIASAGLSGEVVLAIGRQSSRGRLTYLLTTLACLLRYRPVTCRVEVDGELFYDGGFFLTAVANGQYFGQGMHVAPRAVLDNGLVDVVVAPPVPLWQLPYRLPQFLLGRHLDLPVVQWRRAERVRLVPGPGFPPFDVDGESLPSGPVEIRVLPGALRVAG